MKTTVKITFREHQSQMGILVFRVTRHRETRTILTSYELSFDEWDESLQKVIMTKCSLKRKRELTGIDDSLQKDLQLILKTIEILEEREEEYSSQDVAKYFREQKQGQMFCRYTMMKSESLKDDKRFGTSHAYKYAAVSFLKFRGGEDVSIENIDAKMVQRYEHYLKKKHVRENTISCYMRMLRASYNSACRDNIFLEKDAVSKPFASVFTGYAKTDKRAVGHDNISRLINVKMDEENEQSLSETYNEFMERKKEVFHSLEFTRDLFLFSFYTQGMNFYDMVNLTKRNIKEGAIRYKRKKTGQTVTVKMEACITEIINRYSDLESDLLFPVLRKYEKCDEYTRWEKTRAALGIFNRNLNRVARMAGIEKHLTSYVARHTWASIASQEGIPIATISRGMGHDSEKTTRIYISQLDFTDVAKANMQILSRFANNTILPPAEESASEPPSEKKINLGYVNLS